MKMEMEMEMEMHDLMIIENPRPSITRFDEKKPSLVINCTT